MSTGVGVVLWGLGKVADDLALELHALAAGVVRATPDVRPTARCAVVVVVPAAGESPAQAVLAARRGFPAAPVVVWLPGTPTASEVVQAMRLPRTDVVLADETARGVVAAWERAVPALAAAPPASAPTGASTTPTSAVTSGVPAPGSRPAPRPPSLGRLDDLPVLDQRVGLVQRLMAREEATIGDVETVVASEPTLVTVVVRTANSAYYHAPRVITNLHDAVVRIGVRQTLALLLETLVQHAFHPLHPEAQAVLTAAWENANLTARFARRLAEWESLGRAEDVYLGALLHNVGECLMVWRLYRSPMRPGQLAEEVPRILAHHESAADMAVERWGMPPLVASLAAYHHRPRPGETPRDASLRRAIVGSWALARRLQGDYLPDMEPVDPAVELPLATARRLVQFAAPEFVGHEALTEPGSAVG